MRKLLLVVLLGVSQFSLAQIPTVDLNSIASYNNLKESLENLKAELDEAKMLNQNLIGELKGYESYFATELSSILGDLSLKLDEGDLRKFTDLLNTSFPDIKYSDLNVQKGSGLEEAFKAQGVNHRNADLLIKTLDEKEKEIKKLRSEFATAESPKLREEISNNIQAELLQYNISMKKLEAEEKKIEAENKASDLAKQKALLQDMLGY